jgi:hypothetical protein
MSDEFESTINRLAIIIYILIFFYLLNKLL